MSRLLYLCVLLVFILYSGSPVSALVQRGLSQRRTGSQPFTYEEILVWLSAPCHKQLRSENLPPHPPGSTHAERPYQECYHSHCVVRETPSATNSSGATTTDAACLPCECTDGQDLSIIARHEHAVVQGMRSEPIMLYLDCTAAAGAEVRASGTGVSIVKSERSLDCPVVAAHKSANITNETASPLRSEPLPSK